MDEKQIGNASNQNHHFNVVETVEAGRPVLFTVPHQWVQGNTLSWPPKKADLIRKDATSKPMPNWIKMDCRVKRKYIPSFEESEFEVAELSGVTTDTEALDVAKKAKRKKKPEKVLTNPTPSSSKLNFNHHFSVESNCAGPISSPCQPTASVSVHDLALAQTAIGNTMTEMVQEGIPSKTPQQPSMNSQAVMYAQQSSWQQSSEMVQEGIPSKRPQQPSMDSQTGRFSEQSSWQQSGSGAQTTPPEYVFSAEKTRSQQPSDYGTLTNMLSQKMDTMEANIKQHITTSTENLLVKTIAAVRCDFDAKIELLLQSKAVSDHQSSFKLDPVSTVEELFQLEQNLLDKDYAQQVMNYMKQFIGDTGDTVNGQNVCYELVDKFFNRQFMTGCSWTGLSRGEQPKIGLKDCKNILNVFFAIVKSVNEHFSVKAMEDFLKSATRNAKKRSELKNIRQSAIKRRGRKQTNLPIVILQVGNDQVIPLAPPLGNSTNLDATGEPSVEVMAGTMKNTPTKFNQTEDEMFSEWSGYQSGYQSGDQSGENEDEKEV